jgi:hypothetical protein
MNIAMFHTRIFGAAVSLACLVGCTGASTEEMGESEGAATATDPRLEESAVGYVLVFSDTAQGGEIAHCAATLISRTVLVTSASCVDPVAFDPKYAPGKKYSFGVILLRDPNQTHDVELTANYVRDVATTTLSPEWRQLGTDARKSISAREASGEPSPERLAAEACNIATVTLRSGVDVTPMPLVSDESTVMRLEESEKPASFKGFGGTKDPSAPVLELRALPVMIRWGMASKEIPLLTEVPPKLGGADSGGPLVLKDKNGKEMLAGVMGGRTTRRADARAADEEGLSFAATFVHTAFLSSALRQGQ